MSVLFPEIRSFTCPDGAPCFVRVWEAGAPWGRFVFLHGIISHGGWYGRMCRYLAQAGLEVHFLDRRGSGLDPQARGDVLSYKTWLADVEAYLESLERVPPRFLAGISWGGKLAAAVARRRPDLVAGLAMLCPGLFAPRQAGPLARLALAAAVRTWLKCRRVQIPLQEPELFTDVEYWQQYIACDPLTLRQVTIRFACADVDLNRSICHSPQEIHVPTLVLLAGRDRIVANPLIRRFYERLGMEHKQLIEYPNAAHTLEFEPDPEPFYRDLLAWAGKLAPR